MMASQQLQSCQRNYISSLVTGLVGCRWRRYQQLRDRTRKKDILWFGMLVVTYVYTMIWLYFWLVSNNDFNDFDWFIYNNLGFWFRWYWLMVGLASVALCYTSFMLVLSLLRFVLGNGLFLHGLHKCVLLIIFAICLAETVIVTEIWRTEWAVVLISLEVFAPFLWFAWTALLTLFSWPIISGWFSISGAGHRIVLLVAYIGLMMFVYLCPLMIRSPCITSRAELPMKPLLFGHRGAPEIAPENTMFSYRQAMKYNVFGVETDVHISYDGIPFLMHDNTLKRTTNIAELGPDSQNSDVSFFNMSDLRLLDAGSWFLQDDPFGTVASLSAEDRDEIWQQKIPTLEEFVDFASSANVSLVFDLSRPPKGHPNHDNFVDVVLDLILSSPADHSRVWWLPLRQRENVQQRAPDFIYVSEIVNSTENLLKMKIDVLNLLHPQFDQDEVQYFNHYNISLNMYVVNNAWLFSFYWCIGVESVTTNRCQHLQRLSEPLLLMSKDVFSLMWLVTSATSFLTVVGMFLLIKNRPDVNQSYIPEAGPVL
ncbi:PREDICTED: glycerophosphodiester phosphodiesterase domain-containing protein 5-like isoform X2 [Priapulus caudatus]|uniref:Glycerophosphodiester phosphodiesterase domain-containing protein 5-like isoform X2 n=1 Tax=Priapulus caudatus TaxID=37621 RepID=A0ABM1E3E1_PRICU|nr:PREDICTED: glycerophosphodiester phosphodiesterase domain-containing protein 5-like isoform X2 [Priapulus caudatus]